MSPDSPIFPSNLTEYEHPFVVKLYSIVLNISFIISTPLFVLMIYLVWKKSHGIGVYKLYMLYTFITSYAYDVILMIWQPVPLFPAPVMASEGILSKSGVLAAYIQYLLYAVSVVHFVMGLSQAIVYRYAQVYPGRIKNFVDSLRFKWGLIDIHIGFYIIFVVPIFFFIKTTDQVRNELSPFLTNVDEWIQKTSLFSFPSTRYVDIYIYALIFGLGYTMIGSFSLYIFYAFRFFKMLKKGSKKTKRIQLILFKAITVQIMLALLLLQIPSFVIMLLLKFQVPHGGTLATICFMITSLHASVEFLSLCYFMKPYRNFILSKISQISGKRLFKHIAANEKESHIKSDNANHCAHSQDILKTIREEGSISPATDAKLKELVTNFLAGFKAWGSLIFEI